MTLDLSATRSYPSINSLGRDFDIVSSCFLVTFDCLSKSGRRCYELTVIAREVWGGKEHVSMHAKLLDSLASQDVTESKAVTQASCYFITRLDLLIRLSGYHHPIRMIRDYS